MFVVAHQADCDIVTKGPTIQTPVLSMDGDGAMFRSISRPCNCDYALIEVTEYQMHRVWKKVEK